MFFGADSRSVSEVGDESARAFYDDLAPDYHLIYPNWDLSIERQGHSLQRLIADAVGDGRRDVLDCACGIGTQAIGLAQKHQVTGSDVSPVAAARTGREAVARGRRVATVAADMRELPFDSATFDVVVCGDNSLAHMMTLANLRAALASMTRVLRPGGLLILTTRTDDGREEHPTFSPVQVTDAPDGRVLTFQLWNWHSDGEHYDMQHIQLLPDKDGYQVRVRRLACWAVTCAEITEQANSVGLVSLKWHEPSDSGFFQPVLTCRKPMSK